MRVDAVIVSTDDNPIYSQFWPLIAAAWCRVGIQPVLAYIGEPCIEICSHGPVAPFPRIKGIPSGNLAKVSRICLALQFADKCAMLSDLDMLPLQSKYFLNAAKSLKSKDILNLSADAYDERHMHKYPICYWIGRGDVWREIFNPKGLTWIELVSSWCNKPKKFDEKEDPSNIVFSDESLVRKIMADWSGSSSRFRRGKRGWRKSMAKWRINRNFWEWDKSALKAGHYIDAHMPRPMDKHIYDLSLLVDQLKLPLCLLEKKESYNA